MEAQEIKLEVVKLVMAQSPTPTAESAMRDAILLSNWIFGVTPEKMAEE